MLENNNGQVTPRFFDDDKLRKKNNKSSPTFKKNMVPLCKEEKPVFISYKPKAKKYYSTYEQINNKKENLQYISDVAQNYKFIENFKNKDLVDTAFKIDKDKNINYSQTNDLNILNNTGNNFQKFYQTISNFKANKQIPPLANYHYNNKKQNNNINDLNRNNNNSNNKAFSQSQNNFLPKYARMYNKKRINLESKNTNNASTRNSSPGGNLFATKNNFFRNLNNNPKGRESERDTINISSSDEENNLVVNISKIKKKNKKKNLHDIELKFDCFDSCLVNNNNFDKTTENFNNCINNINNLNNFPLEISETETKFFKKYLNYIAYIKKKRLNSPENKQNQFEPYNNNNNNQQNFGLTSNNLSPKFLGINAPNNSNYKEFQPKRNFNKIDISPFDVDIMHFRNAVAKSAELVLDSIKARENLGFNNGSKPLSILEIEKTKKKIFKEIGQNPIFEKLLDKVFRKVIYVSDKNIEICEDFVVNLIHNEIGQLTSRNTSLPSDNSNSKATSGKAKTVNLPPITKKGKSTNNNTNLNIADNLLGFNGNSQEQKPRSRLDLKGALSPIGEIELDTESKFKVFSSEKNFSSKNNKENDNNNNNHAFGTNNNGDKLDDSNKDANGLFYENYKNNFQQQFDAENKSTKGNDKNIINGENGNNLNYDYRKSIFFNKFFNKENKKSSEGAYDFVSSKSLDNSVDYEKNNIIDNENIEGNKDNKINEDENKQDINLQEENNHSKENNKKIFKNKLEIENYLTSLVQRKRKDSPKLNLKNFNNKKTSEQPNLFSDIANEFNLENKEKDFLAFELRKSKWEFLYPHKSAFKNTNSSIKDNICQNAISKRMKSDNNIDDEANATLNSDKESMRFIRSNIVKQAGDNSKDNNNNDADKLNAKNIDNNSNNKASNNISYGVTNFLGSNTSTGFFGNSSSLGVSLNAKLNNENINNNNLNNNSLSDSANKTLTGFNASNLNMNAFGLKKNDYTSNISLIPEEKEASPMKPSKDAKSKKTSVGGKTAKDNKSSGANGKKASGPGKKGKKENAKKNENTNNNAANKDNKENNNEKQNEDKNEKSSNIDNNVINENKNNSKSASKFASSASLINTNKLPSSAKKKESSIKNNLLKIKGKHKSQFAVLDSEGNDIIDADKHRRNGSSQDKNDNVNTIKNENDGNNKNNFETINFDDLENINLADLNFDDLPKDLASSINDLLSKAIYRTSGLNMANLPSNGQYNPDSDNRSNFSGLGDDAGQFEEILITDEEDPTKEKKKIVRIPANRKNSAMNIIARLQANGEEVDINLLKSILNLNDDNGSNLNRDSNLNINAKDGSNANLSNNFKKLIFESNTLTEEQK